MHGTVTIHVPIVAISQHLPSWRKSHPPSRRSDMGVLKAGLRRFLTRRRWTLRCVLLDTAYVSVHARREHPY